LRIPRRQLRRGDTPREVFDAECENNVARGWGAWRAPLANGRILRNT
jgi:hypothetical protein